jgi:hypothetical protein
MSPAFRLIYTPPAQMHTVLPVARVAAGTAEHLVDAGGFPVWPLSSPEDWNAIKSVAQLFGGSLTEVDSHPGVFSGGDEVVMGIGDVGDELALYGHLTGRRVLQVASATEVPVDAPPAVVLGCGTRLDRDLAEVLSLASFDFQATGIIWGRSRAELLSQVLSSAAAATLNGPAATRQLSLVGSGGPTDPSGIRADEMEGQLRSGVGLLTISGHGDGVGLALGSGTALCARDTEWKVEAEPERAPECMYSGICHRVKLRVEDASAGRRLIPPGVVTARVMVNLSCHGAFLGSPGIDSRWSILPGLIANPRIGALLAVPELSHVAPNTMGQEFIRALSDGVPVGRAIVRLEENPTIREVGCRMLLFGDPRVRAVPAKAASMVKAATQSVQVDFARKSTGESFGPGPGSPLSSLELMRRIAGVLRPETREAALRTSQVLVDRIGELEDEGDIGGATYGTRGQAVRSAVLEHLATTKARLFEAWEGSTTTKQLEGLVDCPNCGWRSRPRLIFLPSGRTREFRVCASCSDILDVDLGSEVRPFVDFPSVGLEKPYRSSGWAGAVYCIRVRATETQTFPWPVEEDGVPSPRFELDAGQLSKGPLRVYALFIDGLAIQSASASVALV